MWKATEFGREGKHVAAYILQAASTPKNQEAPGLLKATHCSGGHYSIRILYLHTPKNFPPKGYLAIPVKFE